MIQALISWAPAGIWAVFLFFLSAQSEIPGADSFSFPLNDKVAHFGLFAVLGTALAWGGRRSRGLSTHLVVLLLGAVFAATDEWHQAFVPLRDPSLWDLAADLAGLAVGYALARLVFRPPKS